MSADKKAAKPEGKAGGKSEVTKKTDDLEFTVITAAHVGGERDAFKVLSLRCIDRPEAGLLKMIGDAEEGDKVKVTVKKA